jgi:REP element-mobilizing transposase RayT
MKERKHLRLTDWDYSSEGVYFTTICCKDRQSYFGSISNNEIVLSEIGLIASQYWLEIPDHFPHVKLDEFIIMPNHIHGILILDYSLVGIRHGVSLQSPSRDIVGSCHDMTLHSKIESNQNINQFSKPLKNSISVIINQYKSSAKRWCNRNGFDHFQWQSRFYDQILHNENSIDKIREYICNNPKNWAEDELYN